MKAKVALNLTYLKPREQLAKFQAAINKCTGNTAIGTTNPTLTNCQSSLDAAKGVLDNIDAEELKLTNLRVQRDQSLEMAMSAYGLLGSFVENKSNGDPAVITSAGCDVAGTRTPEKFTSAWPPCVASS